MLQNLKKLANLLTAAHPQARFPWRLVAVLFALALLPRLAAVVAVPDRWLEGHAGDAETYWQLADYLLETGVYGGAQGDDPQRSKPDAYLPPMYPLLLAGTALLAGHNPAAVNVVQAMLGALVCVFTYYISTLSHADRRVAWLAFAATAFYPVFLLWIDFHLTETLYTFFLTAMMLCLLMTHKQYQGKYALLAGTLFSLTMLTREALVFWPPFLLVFWLLDRYDWHKKLMALGSFLIGAVLVFAPWWTRNAVALDCMVLTTERMDRALISLVEFAAPFDLHWDNLCAGSLTPSSSDELTRAVCDAGAVYGALFERNTPTEMERSPAETCCKYNVILGKKSVGESLSLEMACFGETWLHPNGLWSVPKGLPQTLYLAAHIGMMAVGLIGLVISLKRRLAWPMVLMLVYGTIAHVTRGALPRYVLPYMPMVFVFVSCALVSLYDRLRKGRQSAPEDTV
jgi:4-amino-4-deoxy-L-arabinose transferase-like glycosyltransferase